jgi:hypothetical protein
MDPAAPQTPDVDLPGQQHDQADLDIVVEPEPGPDDADDAEAASPDDPEAGNTLIRPENS